MKSLSPYAACSRSPSPSPPNWISRLRAAPNHYESVLPPRRGLSLACVSLRPPHACDGVVITDERWPRAGAMICGLEICKGPELAGVDRSERPCSLVHGMRGATGRGHGTGRRRQWEEERRAQARGAGGEAMRSKGDG
jgi:hypothetical protein